MTQGDHRAARFYKVQYVLDSLAIDPIGCQTLRGRTRGRGPFFKPELWITSWDNQNFESSVSVDVEEFFWLVDEISIHHVSASA
jgi:hypothetical protein